MNGALYEYTPPVVAVVSTIVSIALLIDARGRWVAANVNSISEQNEWGAQLRGLQSDSAFYEERLTSLSSRATQRRLLSEAARALGSMLDPSVIQQKLVSAATQLFPGQQVTISYGQTPDAVDAYVIQRRQPVLVPSEVMEGVPTLAAPVSAQQAVVGVLKVGGAASSKTYTRDDLRLLEILANLASLAMDNCMLFHSVQQNALRDNLTGLLTHRAFDDQMEQAILEASRYTQPLSLILADIDHFKSVNDTYGHQAGDAVLQGFAHVLDRNTRPVDIIARYGGEEFVIVLLQTPHAEAVQIAEKIRRDMSEQAFDVGGRTLAITGSFGVATFPDDATSQQQLFRQADQRMYKAKSGGRNQVRSRAS
jgi:diguanylate cyclase (GGDEF)-like protein